MVFLVFNWETVATLRFKLMFLVLYFVNEDIKLRLLLHPLLLGI